MWTLTVHVCVSRTTIIRATDIMSMRSPGVKLPRLPPRPLPSPPDEPPPGIHEGNAPLLRRRETRDEFDSYKRDYATRPGTVHHRDLDPPPASGSLGSGDFSQLSQSDMPALLSAPTQSSSAPAQQPRQQLGNVIAGPSSRPLHPATVPSNAPSRSSLAEKGRRGGRQKHSHLPEQARQKSHKMRKVAACWRCAMQRDPVSYGAPLLAFSSH